MRGRKPIPFENRFWPKVDKRGSDECWNWTASTWGLHREYGKTKMNGKVISAHCASWIIHNGPIPNGVEVCHICDNGLCVNPAHLWLGTHQQNMQDREDKFHRPRYRGEESPRAKLTWDDVDLIREQLSCGVPRKYVANTFNVTVTTIRDIDLNRHWKLEWRPNA